MTIRRLIHTAIILGILLLCCALAFLFYLHREGYKRQKEFNLYSLVPQDAIAVVETDKMLNLVEDINRLDCSKDGRYLNISTLFNLLKNYLNSFAENTPHGLSTQMNKMVLSFHEPDTPDNQVLYCALGYDDSDYILNFINQFQTTGFEEYKYRGEKVCVIPIINRQELYVYFKDHFMVVALKKTLLHKVIDARKDEISLMNDESFLRLYALKQPVLSTAAYVKMKDVELGSDNLDIMNTPLGDWAEFNFLFDEDAIYCSGMNCQGDSLSTFMNLIARQEPLSSFPGGMLPQTTFFFNTWSLKDVSSFFQFTNSYASNQELANRWADFLKGVINHSVLSCLFRVADGEQQVPCGVLRISLNNQQEAEDRLVKLLADENRLVDAEREERRFDYSPSTSASRRLRIHTLPDNILHTQLTGTSRANAQTYATFYDNAMLISFNKQSLQAYVDVMEKGNTMDGELLYERMTGSLATSYNLMMMVDMERIVERPESYVRYIPNFFYRHAGFFRHFTFVIQLVNVDGVAHSNVVLLYDNSGD